MADATKTDKAGKAKAQVDKGDKGKKAATPSRKFSPGDTAKRGQEFFRGVWLELKKVHWLTPKELAVYTSVVVVSTIIVGFLIWVVDMGLSATIQGILPRSSTQGTMPSPIDPADIQVQPSPQDSSK